MGEHVDRLVALAAAHQVKGYKTKSGKAKPTHMRGGEGPEHRATVQRLLALQAHLAGLPPVDTAGDAEV